MAVSRMTPTNPWRLSYRADPTARAIADRHYNRQSIGAANFVPPGRCVVLLSRDNAALWVTSYPFAEYVKHAWAGAWVCSTFRNESTAKASDLVLAAVAATRFVLGEPPPLGMITFINRDKVRKTRVYGYTYRRAGFKEVGETKGGLLALQLLPHDMPPPLAPGNSQCTTDQIYG